MSPLRRFLTAIAATTVVGVTLLSTAVGAAGESLSVSIDAVGWWTSRPAANDAGDGAFEIANGPEGAEQSVAAVRITLPPAEIDTLDLTLTESSALAEFGGMFVCRSSPFEPVDNGAAADAPARDCATKVVLTRSADAGLWFGDLAPLARNGGTVDLFFAGTYTPPTPLGSGTVVRIAEIQLEASGEALAPPTTTTSFSPPTTSTPTTSFSPPTTSRSFTPPPSVPTSPTFTPTTSAARVSNLDDTSSIETFDGVAAPSATTGGQVGADGVFTLGEAQAFAEDPIPWIRMVAVLPLSAGLGVGAVYGRRWLDERAA